MSRLNRTNRSTGFRISSHIESLESRQLLSVVSPSDSTAETAHLARVAHREAVHAAKLEARQKAHQDVIAADGAILYARSLNSSPVTGEYNPTQVRTAYGITSLAGSNQGQGVTVAIVDVYVDPTITSDVATFSTQYGLPQLNGVGGNPTFTINNGQSASNSPTSGPNDTTLETALDVEWVHSIAPYANIDLVYANSFSYNSLLSAVQTASQTPGVVAVSTSYGGPEFSGETSYESYLSGSTVPLDFSTGDDAYPSFPATSTSVLAVGGTSLYTSSIRGKYSFETAWGGLNGAGAGGGGPSSQYPVPTFQSNNGVNFGSRSIPDVSAIADPVTGVSVLDTDDGLGWTGVGGTSLACPVVSAMIALAQQNRKAGGLSLLNSPQINARLYAIYDSPAYSTDFNDITLGNNNDVGSGEPFYSAGTGYDLATGIGSPKGASFVAALSTP